LQDLQWPDRWQAEAIAAATPYVDTEHRFDIWLRPELLVHATQEIDGALVAF
jgi:hypothetical protein